MHVAACGTEVAVPCEVSQRIRIQVLRPSGEARMPERIEREMIEPGNRTSLLVLPSERRLLDMTALGGSREPSRLWCAA